MCSPAMCQKCKKVTWSGCGNHATAVLNAFPVEQRCSCR